MSKITIGQAYITSKGTVCATKRQAERREIEEFFSRHVRGYDSLGHLLSAYSVYDFIAANKKEVIEFLQEL